MITKEEVKAAITALAVANEEGAITPEYLGNVLDKLQQYAEEGLASFVKSFEVITSISELPASPTDAQKTVAYVLGAKCYVYVGEGGDTSDGKYQSVGFGTPTDTQAKEAVEEYMEEHPITIANASEISTEEGISDDKNVQSDLLELNKGIRYTKDYADIEMTDSIMNGYIDASTGLVSTWTSDSYQILSRQITANGVVKLTRTLKSGSNANVVAIVDDISIVVEGADLSSCIVDNGKTTPLEKEVAIKANQYVVVGYLKSNRTAISFAESCMISVAIEDLAQKESDDIARMEESILAQESMESADISSLNNKIAFPVVSDSVAVTDVILGSAFINTSGKIDSWTSENYNIYAYQAQEEQYIKIVKKSSVYATNEVLCKCNSIDNIAIGSTIDGEVLCVGTSYPFETLIHLNAGEYILRSGVSTLYSDINVVVYKNIREYARSLDGLKVDFEGDSVMIASSADGGWPTLIQAQEGIVATNNGIGGSRIAKNESSMSILERIESRVASDFDMIIIGGGFNDGTTPIGTFDRNTYYEEGADEDYDATTYYGALEIICRYCLKNFSKSAMIVQYNWALDKWNTTLADAMIEVCEKWGMPYVDLRSKAGFNLKVESLREKYGLYNGDVPEYDSSKGYGLDEKIKYESKVYKANKAITAPAGVFDSSLWTYIGLEYDQCHCNIEGYKKSVGAIVDLMKSL